MLAAGMLAACNSADAGGSSGSGAVDSTGLTQAKAIVAQYNSAPTKIPQTVPLPSKPPTGKTLAFLVQQGVSANALVGNAEKAAVQGIGWNFVEIPYDGSNPATLQAAFSTALSKHADVVNLTAIPTSLFGASTLAAYKSAHVPIVVGAEAPVPPAGDPVIQTGDPDGPATFQLAAKVVAAWFVADSGGKGSAVIESVPTLSVIGTWVDEFKSEVSTLCPKLCKVQVVNATLTQATSPGENGTLLTSTLRRNPSYKYLFFSDATFASGINSALSSAGLTDIKVGGSDFQSEQAAALRSHTQAAWTGVSLQNLAYGNVDYALRAVEGAPLTTNNDQLPIELVTPENIGDQTTFNQPADSLQQYEKLWQGPSAK
jgi:ribose transport system substrate-binding protein